MLAFFEEALSRGMVEMLRGRNVTPHRRQNKLRIRDRNVSPPLLFPPPFLRLFLPGFHILRFKGFREFRQAARIQLEKLLCHRVECFPLFFSLSFLPPFLAHTIRFERRAKNVEYFPNFPPL